MFSLCVFGQWMGHELSLHLLALTWFLPSFSVSFFSPLPFPFSSFESKHSTPPVPASILLPCLPLTLLPALPPCLLPCLGRFGLLSVWLAWFFGLAATICGALPTADTCIPLTLPVLGVVVLVLVLGSNHARELLPCASFCCAGAAFLPWHCLHYSFSHLLLLQISLAWRRGSPCVLSSSMADDTPQRPHPTTPVPPPPHHPHHASGRFLPWFCGGMALPFQHDNALHLHLPFSPSLPYHSPACYGNRQAGRQTGPCRTATRSNLVCVVPYGFPFPT